MTSIADNQSDNTYQAAHIYEQLSLIKLAQKRSGHLGRRWLEKRLLCAYRP